MNETYTVVLHFKWNSADMGFWIELRGLNNFIYLLAL